MFNCNCGVYDQTWQVSSTSLVNWGLWESREGIALSGDSGALVERGEVGRVVGKYSHLSCCHLGFTRASLVTPYSS